MDGSGRLGAAVGERGAQLPRATRRKWNSGEPESAPGSGHTWQALALQAPARSPSVEAALDQGGRVT